MGISSTQVNNRALGARLEIELPSIRKLASRWGRIDTQSGTLAVGGNVSSGLGLQGTEGFEVKALPYLSLPTGVKAFDGSLETGFSGRSKDSGDSQAQTQTDHRPRVSLNWCAPWKRVSLSNWA